MAFKDIIGQDKAINIIFGTIARNRVPSAYLFVGESGIGKKLTAINLAKAMNCLKTVTSDRLPVVSQKEKKPETIDYRLMDCCDECLSCKKIEVGTHPDFLMVSPEKGEIRVDEIRAVEDALSLKPFEGRRKVVIIDDADAMNQSAANAFLKTLEEPPDESLLILITAHPDRLPETIRSRCSRINFTPLAHKASERVIKKAMGRPDTQGSSATKIKKGESIQLEEAQLRTLVKLSMGRPGLAISYDIVKERERFIALFRNMLDGDNETWTDREEMERWLDMAFLLLRDMAVLKIGDTGRKGGLLNEDIRDFVSEKSKATDIKGIIGIYERLSSLRGQLGFNLNKAVTRNYVASVVKSLAGG